MLNARELTGRASTHVLESPELRCILHPEALIAAKALKAAAREAGLDVGIVSAFRSFDRQVTLWNAKFRGERPLLDRAGVPLTHASLDPDALIDAILIWSALPGASRHHWGTDLDVVDYAHATPGYRFQLTAAEFAPGGPCALLDQWLTENMARFGFFRPYATDLGGVQPEPWHLSFAPVSVPALQLLTLDTLREAIAGSEMLGRERVLARLPELYAKFVLAVSPPGAAVSAAGTKPS
jgi:LAS superfamily LD-carboxypeptidase LdcB